MKGHYNRYNITIIDAIITLKYKTKYINDTRLDILNIVIESFKLVEYVYMYIMKHNKF